MFEYYLKKRVWWTFVKDFKEKYVLNEPDIDYVAMTTPVSNRLRKLTVDDVDKSFDSVFARNITEDKGHKLVSEIKVPVADMTKGSQEEIDTSNEGNENKIKNSSDILSPMSALSNCFSQMKIKDESWSEKATLDSSQVTDDDGNSDKIHNGHSVINKDNVSASTGEDKPTNGEKNNEEGTCNTDNLGAADKEPPGSDKIGEKTVGNDRNMDKTEVIYKRRLLSEGSESTASFETAAEDVSDGNNTFCSQLSEPGTFKVVLNLKNSAIFMKLKDYVNASELRQDGINDCSVVNFIVQVKDSKRDVGMKVNIVSLPEIESVQKLLLLEEVEIESCDGDIDKVQEGETVELGTSGKDHEGNQSVMAYLTKAVTLPKTKYIYG